MPIECKEGGRRHDPESLSLTIWNSDIQRGTYTTPIGSVKIARAFTALNGTREQQGVSHEQGYASLAGMAGPQC